MSNTQTASVKMSTAFDPAYPESFGHDYDSTDFDMEILEDLDLLKKVMGKETNISTITLHFLIGGTTVNFPQC